MALVFSSEEERRILNDMDRVIADAKVLSAEEQEAVSALADGRASHAQVVALRGAEFAAKLVAFMAACTESCMEVGWLADTKP